MGGVVEGGVDIADKTSPRRVEIEKVQAVLREEYDFREKRKRELEFLESGGDPLEFIKDRIADSVSVQSTSFTNQLPDQLTSEAKGSFALTASTHGDSVESSGRLGTNLCEPHSADNLMLFDAGNEISKGRRNSSQHNRSDIVPSEKLSQVEGNRISHGHGDSDAFNVPRKAYRRRNRSRPNRDGTRSSSTDVNLTFCSQGSTLPPYRGTREVKGSISDAEVQNAQPNCNSKPTSPIISTLHKNGLTDNNQEPQLSRGKANESTKDQNEVVAQDTVCNAVASETAPSDERDQQSPPEDFRAMEKVDSAALECMPSATNVKVENISISCETNKKEEEMKMDDHKSSSVKVLDSQSSCSHTNISIDENNDSELCTKIRNADSNGNTKDQTLAPDAVPVGGEDEFVKEKKEIDGVDSSIPTKLENSSAYPSQQDNEVINQSGSALENEVNGEFALKGTDSCVPNSLESGREPSEVLANKPGPQKENSNSIVNSEPRDGGSASADGQTASRSASILLETVDEDSILKEAQLIEAKRKRIGELSVATSPKQIHPKSHWDLVLEEMAWLANDFAQERVWKRAAAAQISNRAAFTIRLRNQEKFPGIVSKKVANNLAKSVMEFWRSIEEAREVPGQQSQKDKPVSVKDYAVRFLAYNKSSIVNQAEMPSTPDRLSDMGVVDLSWEDNLTEENLFYTVPAGAMETYKNSIEFHTSHYERIGNNVQEEVETSTCDFAAEFQDNMYDEDEGETGPYDVSIGFGGNRSSRPGPKKRKHLAHAYRYDASSDIFPMQQSASVRKRPGSNLNVSIPTKRVRTASRRVISPFRGGTPGFVQAQTKADASSGDTNSFQDDQNSLHGGSFVPNNLEVESARDFEVDLPFDSAEVSMKHKKKKKKAKHLNSPYEPRWQVDSTFQNEQFHKDRVRKSYQFDSNGSSGLLGQPMMKKPKIMMQSQESSFENLAPFGGSVPSPAASQMSNMSNPNKVIKLLGGRDRGRKSKTLKMPTGQQGSGSPWTQFEDQALVVLVHDMGPNWELVSDAFNSTVQFKCVFRKAKECKERHHHLMDRTSGDGADSAEDSGSSQPYPSTLPGIPRGSARQLFQRLQGPMEEETIKSHFEKIIGIGQKLLYRKSQNDNQDRRQLQQPHNSHAIALSQVCPNNLNGSPVLTPLDLCDSTPNGSDIIPVGYQGSPGALAIPNQGTVAPMPDNSSMLPGSPNVMLGNNFSSSPGALNSSVRYGVPRSTALSADDQRLQQYNQMVSNRNTAQPHISSPGTIPGADRGIRLLPGSNGGALAGGVNRNIPMSRHGFQGISPSSIANSGSPGVPPTNLHSGVGSGGQGSLVLRPREALHAVRPGLGQDSPRQMATLDLQMQASPRNGQGVSHFGRPSSPFPNPAIPPPVSSHPMHHQPSNSPQGSANHAPTPQQQAYAMRLAKERRFLQLHQQQFTPSSSSIPHVQSQSQLPISSVQNSSQVQPQTNSMPKHQIPTQVVARNAQSGSSGLTNQVSKQRPRQQQPQFSQANRQHPQPRQQLQAKLSKGVGRGTVPQIDPTLVNGVSTSPGNPPSEKGEEARYLLQNQAASPGSALHSVQLSSQSQKMYDGQKLVNPNQSALRRTAIQANRQINSDPSNKQQARVSDIDRHATSSPVEMDNSSSANVGNASPSSAHQWHVADAQTLNSVSNTSPASSIPLNSTDSTHQGLGQRPSSSVPQSQKHNPSQLPTQKQAQLLQAGNGRNGDSRIE